MLNDPGDQRTEWARKLAEQARLLGESRVIRDGQEMTPQLRELVLARVREYLQRTGRPVEFAARSSGLDAKVISGLLAGESAEQADAVRQLDRWLESQLLKEAAPRPAGFVRTGIVERIYGVARWMMEIGGIGLVHGPAGIGKTIALQAIRAETPGSILISVRTVGLGRAALMNQLAEAIRLPVVQYRPADAFRQIEGILRDTGRLIIVDEIHKLCGRRSDEALHVLRDLHDGTGCPMVWSGQSNIATYISQGRETFEPLDQIASRIKFWLDLTAIATRSDGGPGLYTIEDIRQWIEAQKIRVTPDAIRYLQMLANEYRMGGLRTCDGLLRVAVKVFRDKPISAEILRSILAEQRGLAYVEAIDREMEQRGAIVAAG